MSVLAARAALTLSGVTASVGKYRQEQIDHPIYNGRLFERHGPPVIIYNESLAKLKHGLSDLASAPEPSANCIALAAKLFHAGATIYESESQRGKVIYHYVERLLGTTFDRSTKVTERSNMTTEAGTLVYGPSGQLSSNNKKVVVAYVELKNELGICGDGALQAALTLRKCVAQKRAELPVIVQPFHH
jgi:hypothetical protein